MSYTTMSIDPETGTETYDIEWFKNVKVDEGFKYQPLEQLNPLSPAILHQLREYMVPDMYVAGGSCITHINPMHSYNDIDIYVSTQEAMNHTVQILVALGLKELTGQGPCPEKIKVWSDTINTVQLIFVKEIVGIAMLLSSFDMEICKIGFDKDNIAIGKHTKSHIIGKCLNVSARKNQSPEKTLARMFKYVSKGYTLSESGIKELVKLIKGDNTPTIKSVNLKDSQDQELLKGLLEALGPKGNIRVPQQQQQTASQGYIPAYMPHTTPYFYPPQNLTTCTNCGMTYDATFYHQC